ncbi:MAG: peptidase M14 [Gemmatimonadetes bacterium]|nr:peptidase M14 [Gemmatimonadota bacterium]
MQHRTGARRASILWLLVAAACAPRPGALRPDPVVAVPAPASHLGFEVGADRKLADWNQITSYLTALAQVSPRVRLDTLGETTLGRPFLMATISSPATLARLDSYREIQRQLADPRLLPSEGEAERLIAQGKTVVLITASIHSTEVGGSQVPLRIAHRLASSSAPAELEILENTIVLLVPSLNPDGVDLVGDWYESTLGQPWEGASPPFLYHHYVGHDNNRDWYAFTQRETQLTVERVHNVWRPQIVHDIHQMGSRGARIFFPPYIDPIEPNVDPLLVAGVNQLGSFMAASLTAAGKRGVVGNAIYDAWTPARAYSHYHGGVRILSETASANLASPIRVPFDSLQPGRNYDARQASWNFPEPWPGGEWRLADIVDYMEAGAFALLTHAARHRAEWLRAFLEVGERAVGGWPVWPAAWLIPAEQENPAALNELLRILVTADVEVHRAGVPFRARVNGPAAAGRRRSIGVETEAAGPAREFPAGTYVVPMGQPYAAFAQAMLERQEYPDLRLYPGGPPKRPYDVTAHTLPLLLGVQAVAAESVEPGVDQLALSEPVAAPEVRRFAPGLTRREGGGGRTVAAAAPLRIGLYQSYAPSMDEGWTRWLLEAYSVPYKSLHDSDIRAGQLGRSWDVVILASQSPADLVQGRRAGSVPPQYAGGLGGEGVAALAAFVQEGGTLVTLEEASRFALEHLQLPLRDVVAGLPAADFFIPGSILRLELDGAHALAAGMPEGTIAWYGEESLAFEATAPQARIVGRYGSGDPLLSGWALGRERVAGRGALAEVEVGAGRVILFGFRPQYRGQSMATFPLFFNALAAPRRGPGVPASWDSFSW